MDIIETAFSGLKIIKPIVLTDNRGYFLESFNRETFRKAGIDFSLVQDNESKSSIGVIRGLHFQLKPYQQAKLIRVVQGKIFDVALDLRKSSSTYGKWFSIELDSDSKSQLFIPAGFAHGYSVLSETAIIQYKVDNVYDKLSERGIFLNDPELNINWPTGGKLPVISEKDLKNPPFREAEYNF